MPLQPESETRNPSFTQTVWSYTGTAWVISDISTVYHGSYTAYQRRLNPWPLPTTSQWAARRLNPDIWVPPTSVFHEVVRKRDGYGSVSFLTGGGYTYIQREGSVFPEISATGLAIDATQLRAQTVDDLLGNISGQKVDLSVAFLERKETSRFLLTTAQRLARFASYMHRGRYTKGVHYLKRFIRGESPLHMDARHRLKDVAQVVNNLSLKSSEAILEMNYAVRPLLADVYGSAEAIAAADLREPTRYRVKATATREKDYEALDVIDESGIRVTRHVKQRVKIRYVVFYTAPDESVPLRVLESVGLANPASTLFNVTRLSFVADWFGNFGDYLSGQSAALGLVLQSGTRSEVLQLEDKVSWRKSPGSSYETVLADCKPSYFSYRREVLDDFPRPEFYLKDNPLSDGRWASAFALFRTAFSDSASKTHRRIR